MRNGERSAFVAAVFLVGIVECLQEGFLLVCVVLIGLSLRQVRNGAIGHLESSLHGQALF